MRIYFASNVKIQGTFWEQLSFAENEIEIVTRVNSFETHSKFRKVFSQSPFYFGPIFLVIQIAFSLCYRLGLPEPKRKK